MALQTNDLLVVQSQTDSKLYKLKIGDLDTYLEGSSGVQFRGSVDLNNAPSAQTPAISLPAANGDLYIVERNAGVIASGWVMESGVTSANENDRIIWDGTNNYWVLLAGGTNTGGDNVSRQHFLLKQTIQLIQFLLFVRLVLLQQLQEQLMVKELQAQLQDLQKQMMLPPHQALVLQML